MPLKTITQHTFLNWHKNLPGMPLKTISKNTFFDCLQNNMVYTEYVKLHQDTKNKICLLIILAIISALLCFFSFLTLHIKKHESSTQYYYIIAGSLGFAPPIIICATQALMYDVIIADGFIYEYLTPLYLLKNMNNFDIGLFRVIVLLVACFQTSQISDESSPASFYAILGLIIGSFCLSSYLSLLEMLGLIDVAIQRDFGYFKFVIASALCAVQNLYGVGMYMVIVFLTCIMLLLSMPSWHENENENENASNIEDQANGDGDGDALLLKHEQSPQGLNSRPMHYKFSRTLISSKATIFLHIISLACSFVYCWSFTCIAFPFGLNYPDNRILCVPLVISLIISLISRSTMVVYTSNSSFHDESVFFTDIPNKSSLESQKNFWSVHVLIGIWLQLLVIMILPGKDKTTVLIYLLNCAIHSFCVAEFYGLFSFDNGLPYPDLGYFKFVMAACICSEYHMYGIQETHFGIVLITCILLTFLYGNYYPPWDINDDDDEALTEGIGYNLS